MKIISSSHTCQNKRPQPHLNHFYSIISTTRPKAVVMINYPQHKHPWAGSRVKKQTACYVILKLLHRFSPHIQTYSRDIPLIINFMLAVRDPSWLPGPLTLSQVLHSPCSMGDLGSQSKKIPCPAGATNCFLVLGQYRHESWHTDLTEIWIKVERTISKIFREKMGLLCSLKTYLDLL